MQSLGLVWADSRPGSFHELHVESDRAVHRGARRLLEVWSEHQARGGMMVGRDVPSRALARMLSGLALYQPILNGDFRVRLAGEALRRRFGRDATGEKLSDLMSAALFAGYGARLRALLDTGKPLVLDVCRCEGDRSRHYFELVDLRVTAPDGITPWVLSGIFFHDWRL